MSDLDPDRVIIVGVTQAMAADGPLHEVTQPGSDGALFSTWNGTARVHERTVDRLIGRRLLHFEGEKPNRIAWLTQ